MATASCIYPPAPHTNLDVDLAPVVTVPTNITAVQFIGIQIDSRQGGVITCTDPVTQHITVICYQSEDHGSTWTEIGRLAAFGGGHSKGVAADPGLEFRCDPPLLPGVQIKAHVTQVGTYWLGGTLRADYTP